MVALVTGNFDDSQSAGDLWVVAGYLGYRNQWDYFEELWAAALAQHKVPYFHMKEMSRPNGVYAKWHPFKEHQAEVTAFFVDLCGAIKKSGLHMVASAVWVRDLAAFNEKAGQSLEPYPLAAFSCASMAAVRYAPQPVTIVFDRVEQVDSKLSTARVYADSDPQAAKILCDSVAMVPLQKTLTARDVLGMQAADLIAWEVRKAHFDLMRDWQTTERDPNASRDEQWANFVAWWKAANEETLTLRKSLDSLIDSDALKIIVWDQQQLFDTHRARDGVWSLEPASQRS